MASPTTLLFIDLAQFALTIVAFVFLVRLAYVIGANAIGEFLPELVYVRGRDLRAVAGLLLLLLATQMAASTLPFLDRQNWIAPADDVVAFLELIQTIIVFSAIALGMFVAGRYTHRARDRRVRDAMETLAYVDSQRRRRIAVETGVWEPDED